MTVTLLQRGVRISHIVSPRLDCSINKKICVYRMFTRSFRSYLSSGKRENFDPAIKRSLTPSSSTATASSMPGRKRRHSSRGIQTNESVESHTYTEETFDDDERHDDFHLTSKVFSSIIKVFTLSSSPSYVLPWQNKPTKESTGSGFAIKGRKIITNAHVVADHKFVQVRKLGSALKFQVKVLKVCHQSDLALLELHDSPEVDEFWKGVHELELGDSVPCLQDVVTVIGYPIGGDTVSVTQGVVSRVEPQQYVHGNTSLLAIQIDAAINPGNSGGPALRGHQVVGVAFQNLLNASSIGFIIPVPIINHFLHDTNDDAGLCTGYSKLGIQVQRTDNIYLQRYLKTALPTHYAPKNGVRVSKVYPFASAAGHLEKGDVVVSIDGRDIACDGTVEFRHNERIAFEYLISLRYAGETINLQIFRDGEAKDLVITLKTLDMLVRSNEYDTTPSFFIFAGITFVPVTMSYLCEYGNDWYNEAPRDLVHIAANGVCEHVGQQVVVMSQVLLDEVNVGYQSMIDVVVDTVNGDKVIHLKGLKKSIEEAVHAFKENNGKSSIELELSDGRMVLLDIARALGAERHIMEQHRIPASCSKDLISEVHVANGNDIEAE